MGTRARTVAFAASATLLCGSLLLALVGFATNPLDCHLSITRDLHVGVLNNGLDSRLVFFNDSDYGPYRGSIVGLAGDEYPHTNAFGDAFGIYYRHFSWPDTVLWTVMVSRNVA